MSDLVDENYTLADALVSDLHKAVHGYRPSELWRSSWNKMSLADKQATWDVLREELENIIAREQAMADLAHEKWTAHLAQLMSDNGISYETALRWDMAAMDAADDAGYYCYKWGISYAHENDINVILKKECL